VTYCAVGGCCQDADAAFFLGAHLLADEFGDFVGGVVVGVGGGGRDGGGGGGRDGEG
jgi:hypothetical protein